MTAQVGPSQPRRRCAKKRYRQRGDALIALWKCGLKAERDLKSDKRQERRAYQCPHCGGWHLTSQEPNERSTE